MRRDRLKNIVNKSKEVSNKQQLVGESPFEQFKNSLPEELESFKGDNYRLEAAWKAYGSPKNYEEAVWLGLVNPLIPGKMPSIGYNEESDEYEYLNTGKENDTVAKDIRVWDNDVIPLVKELKLGGYVRTFNEEKNCWTYSKNPQKGIEPSEDNEQQVNKFQNGGSVPENSKEELFKLIENSDANFAKRLQNPNRKRLKLSNKNWENFKLTWSEDETGTIVYPEIQEIDGKLVDLSNDPEKAWETALENNDYIYFPSNESADWFVNHYKEHYKGFKTPKSFKKAKFIDPDDSGGFGATEPEYYDPTGEFGNGQPLKRRINQYGDIEYVSPSGDVFVNPNVQLEKFKQGGQMNVIPEGALHARKNNMELAKEGEVTHKGIPVVDNQGEQQAEIEKNEIIFTKETTDKIEGYYKKFKDDSTSTSEKDELAIKCGKFLVDQILNNTDDKTGLIEEVKQNI